MIAHLDGLGESAATIGAVNCAVRRGDKLIGENTDGMGFMESMRTLVDPMGQVARPLRRRRRGAGDRGGIGARRRHAITMVNRGEARGRELTALINEKTKARPTLCLGPHLSD